MGLGSIPFASFYGVFFRASRGGGLMNEMFQLSDDQRQQGIEAIKVFFSKERDEDLGDLAAMLILEFISEYFGPYFYNKGINDAKYYLQEKLEDLYGLEK